MGWPPYPRRAPLTVQPCTASPLRVVLVDDHEMVLHGLEAMLARFPEQVAVVGTAADPPTARSAR